MTLGIARVPVVIVGAGPTVSPPRRCSRSTELTALCLTDRPTCTRSPARCTWTMRSTGSSPGWASPTSSQRSRDPLTDFGCWTRRCACWRSSGGTPHAASTASRRPTCSTTLSSRCSYATTSNATLMPRFAATRGHRHHRPGRRTSPVRSPTGPTAASTPRGRLRARLRRRHSVVRAEIGSVMRISSSSTLAGRRRRHRR